jgi:hypothetical protein
MGMLGKIQEDVAKSGGCCKRTRMAKKKIPKLTAEELAEREELRRTVRERIAERRALEREWEERERERQAHPGVLDRIKRSLRAARAAW